MLSFIRRLVFLKRGRMSGGQNAAALKESGRILMGDHCSISPHAVITDPAYVRMGNNVRLSDCHIFGHDGSVNMINRALGTRLDSVGPVVIGNDVFIGHGAIILPNVTIGDRVIVGAGAVVTRDLPGGHVYGGSPAKALARFEDYVKKLTQRNAAYPWSTMIEARGSEFDPTMEPELVRARVRHFFEASPA